ncbi:calmodulin-regulated spectrin-associated protein 3 [Scleropages formosus]|uniref:calmodulin-regulated spectrin-associated protein 3 n=1 Tax=Scleropages formosus TaxID=113540 RepID=UPI0008788B08|nr:calmodulin-regulated spectrin-associated protein 3-like [Scleropages formosus]
MVDSSTMRKTTVVPDIKPLELYDFSRAKIRASLGWILGKTFGTAENVPVELRDPFYCDQYEQEHIKPPVTHLLLSSELYSRAYGLLLGSRVGAAAPPRDNAALLQLLANKGTAPKDQGALVTESDLRMKPIKMSAHLAVIDSLMVVSAMETVSAAQLQSGPEQLGGGASWEKALFYWVNLLNQKLRESTEGELTQGPQSSPDSQSVQPVNRYRKDKMVPRHPPVFPVVTSVKDLSSGCVLAAVIHFYCPNLLRLEDVCWKDTMSAADSLYNLQLIRDFCDGCLKSCCSLALEDFLYSPPVLKLNIMSFLAELLNWFEVQKPDFVHPLEALNLEDSSAWNDYLIQNSGNGNGASPSVFKQPFLPISSAVTPGSLTQSASMSHVEGVGRTWTKKPFSRPLSSAVSFSIPFGLDSDVEVVMGNPVNPITRSVSSDSLNPMGQAMTRAPYTPPEDLSHLVSQLPGPGGAPASNRASWATQVCPTPLRMEQSRPVENGLGEGTDLPTIEEALQIIHNESKLEPRLHPEGAPDGFYLHSPDDSTSIRHNGTPAPLSSSAPPRSGMMYRVGEEREPSRRRNRRTSEGSRDDDSVLRDGSVDSDASEDLPKSQSTPTAPVAASTPTDRPPATRGEDLLDSGVKMTSFAERKKKLASDLTTNEVPLPQMTWTQKSEESPSKSPALNTEMSELGARLEEKRRAIEAQKKRIEAIFAKHRQRLGKSAFLQLKREQQQGEPGEESEVIASSAADDLSRHTPEERLTHVDDEEQRLLVEETGKSNAVPVLEKQVTFSKEPAQGDRGGPAPLGDYNYAVSKLSAALSSLQTDMQRLSEQQNQLMRKKAAASTQAWVIPAGPKPVGSPAPRFTREHTREPPSAASSASPSPSPSRKVAPPKSPQVSHRRAQSAPPKSPKQHHQTRPLELKFPPLTRVLTPPQNVDTLPHLRRVSPRQCQVQTSSSFSLGSQIQDPFPRPIEDNSSESGSVDDHTMFSLDMEGGLGARSDRGAGGSGSGAPSECSFESDIPAALSGKRSSLIEIPLSSLRSEEADDGTDAFSDSMSDQTEPEMKSGVGFFFKEDESRPEDEMEKRRAALLEKQQKRTEEMKRRRQEQEREREARMANLEEPRAQGLGERPQTPCTPPPTRTPPPEGTPQRRGDFTRQEYERRMQLKIMEDLDKVLRQKPTTVRGVKKQRPKTVFRDDSVLSRSPAKGFAGSRLNKVYSHSTLSLSTMANDTGNSGSLAVRKSPSRSHSPSRLMSPGRLASQNGEKDWENASTISSPASVPEYTGPKLYKEPSFKSNKFIIHNAISRCCLAGKVNEPQKNKMVEEMEKSTANHFLILFRDSSCQFRAVYTMNPETEELVRLAGTGPRVVSCSLVESMYKYSSDRKQFTPIPSKTMSMSVDAFTIPAYLWQNKKPGTPKKPSTPK